MPSFQSTSFLAVQMFCVYGGGYLVYRVDGLWPFLLGAVLIGTGLATAQLEGYLDGREE